MKVIAIEQGYDNVMIREKGEVFDMPDDVFDRRPLLDKDGKPIPNMFHEPPSWFVPVNASKRESVEKDRKEIRKARRLPAVSAVNPQRQEVEALLANRKIAEDTEQ